MRSRIVVVALVGAVLAAGCEVERSGPSGSDPDLRTGGQALIGGEPVAEGEFAWTAAVFRETPSGELIFRCHGAVIGKRWVLTTASCIDTLPAGNELFVATGKRKLSRLIDTGRLQSPKAVYVHPQYNSRRVTNNVALIRTVDPLDAPRIRLVGTKQERELAGQGAVVEVSGWGSKGIAEPIENRMQSVPVQIIDDFWTHNDPDSLCDAVNSASDPFALDVRRQHICAGVIPELTGTLCIGDGGAPMVVELPSGNDDDQGEDMGDQGEDEGHPDDRSYRLVGLGSFFSTLGCAFDSVADGYQRVRSRRVWQWIRACRRDRSLCDTPVE